MLKLAAFADEISPALEEQIAFCTRNAITHLELRGVEGKNVLDFDGSMRRRIKTRLTDSGLGVISIGSPIGKVEIGQPWSEHFDRFRIAVDAAEYFQAPLIRVFSYYPPKNGPAIDQFAQEVFDRFHKKIDYLKGRNVTLIHENEKAIFGERCANCVALMEAVNSPQLRSAFDFANFVQAGEKPRDNWPALAPYTVHIHIKDALMGSGNVVPAGQGDGDVARILVEACRGGYDGFASLEPHLASAGQFSGFSGPRLFQAAVDAFKSLCAANDIPLAG